MIIIILVVTRQAICHLVEFPWYVRDIVLELCQIFVPTNLTTARVFYALQEFQSLMVSYDVYGMSEEFILLFEESLHDGEGFLLVHMVHFLRRREFLQQQSCRSTGLPVLALAVHSPSSVGFRRCKCHK